MKRLFALASVFLIVAAMGLVGCKGNKADDKKADPKQQAADAARQAQHEKEQAGKYDGCSASLEKVADGLLDYEKDTVGLNENKEKEKKKKPASHAAKGPSGDTAEDYLNQAKESQAAAEDSLSEAKSMMADLGVSMKAARSYEERISALKEFIANGKQSDVKGEISDADLMKALKTGLPAVSENADEACNYIVEGHKDAASCKGMVMKTVDKACKAGSFKVDTKMKLTKIPMFEITGIADVDKHCCICITETDIVPRPYASCAADSPCMCKH